MTSSSSCPAWAWMLHTHVPGELCCILGSLGHAVKFLAAWDNCTGSAVPDYWERIKNTAGNSPPSHSCFKHALLCTPAIKKTDSSTLSFKKKVFSVKKTPKTSNQPTTWKFHKLTSKPNQTHQAWDGSWPGRDSTTPSFFHPLAPSG